jgi:hypothetical protein
MDSIYQIIKNLKKEEVRSFKLFMQRYDRSEEAKVVLLFDLIRKDEIEDEALIARLFPENPDNANAFYRLRNRLKTELEKCLLNLHHGLEPRIEVMNLINLSNIFTFKSQYNISVYYLKKAEKAAIQNEFYDLLELIYNELIHLSHNFEEINPIEYQEKRKLNAEKNEFSIQADHAVAAIWYRLRRSNFSKNIDGISAEIQNILNELQITNEVYKLPRVKIRIYGFIRDLLLQNRNFKELQSYLIKTYDEFEKSGIFNKSSHTSKINLLTWITNTLIINKKWELAEKYTAVLLDELNRYNKLYYDRFIWTYYQSMTTTYMSSGKLNEAIELLQQISDMPGMKNVNFFDYASRGNLALCFYFKNDLSKAIKTLSHLLSKEMYGKLSPAFQFSISILEIILHFENKSMDYVEYKIAEVKRQFSALLKRKDYQEEKDFLKIMNLLVNWPEPFRDKKILEKVNDFINNASMLQVGSSKYIDCGLWLKSKRDKTNYYRDLLDSLQSQAA